MEQSVADWIPVQLFSQKPVKTCCCSGDLCNTEQFADQCSAASTMMTRQYLFLVVGLVVAVYKLIIIDSL